MRKRSLRLSGLRWKLIVEGHNGSRRISFRVRTLRRPRQINITVSNYTPSKHIKGVS